MRVAQRIKKNISLKKYTTFRIGGRAKYFFEAKNKKDIIEVVKWAKENKLPFFILGGGSNLLVDDNGFDGIVIKIQMSNVKCLPRTVPKALVRGQMSNVFVVGAEAGVKLADLVKLSLKEGLTGLEWAAGIPEATVGGAIRGNAAAFGGSVQDIVKEVEVFDAKDGKIKIFQNKNCGFDYRTSIFKENKHLVILSALIRLKKSNRKTVREKIVHIFDYRRKNHPMGLPSAGSIFKNPQNVSARALVEKCGLKAKRIGEAQISEKHPNFIVNLGGATSKDVLKLINLVKKEVKKKFGIKLKEELQFLGF